MAQGLRGATRLDERDVIRLRAEARARLGDVVRDEQVDPLPRSLVGGSDRRKDGYAAGV